MMKPRDLSFLSHEDRPVLPVPGRRSGETCSIGLLAVHAAGGGAKIGCPRLPFRRDIGRNLNKLIRSSMDDSTMKKWGYDNQQSRGLGY